MKTPEELFGKENWPTIQQHAVHNPLLASALKIIEELIAEIARLEAALDRAMSKKRERGGQLGRSQAP